MMGNLQYPKMLRLPSHRLVATTILLAMWGSAPTSADNRHDSHETERPQNDNKDRVTLALTCDQTYLAGFPILVAVELHKVENSFELMPYFDLFKVPGPVSFVMRGGGHEWTWREMSRHRSGIEDAPEGVEFGPGKHWLALQDLSELHPEIPSGHYELSAAMGFSGYVARSAPVQIEVKSPSKEDQAIATRLRATNDVGKTSWHAFVAENWSTPHTNGLSPAAHERLDYYLYLHRAAYGPKPIAALDPGEPWKWGHSILEAEAAVVRLEILHAAKKPEAAGVEAAILERWPGLAFRVDEIHRDAGLLTILRTSHGVERDRVPTEKPRPYHHK